MRSQKSSHQVIFGMTTVKFTLLNIQFILLHIHLVYTVLCLSTLLIFQPLRIFLIDGILLATLLSYSFVTSITVWYGLHHSLQNLPYLYHLLFAVYLLPFIALSTHLRQPNLCSVILAKSITEIIEFCNFIFHPSNCISHRLPILRNSLLFFVFTSIFLFLNTIPDL